MIDGTNTDGGLPGLTPDERKLLKKMFSAPLDIPQEWLAWLISYIETHPPQLPISQIFGYSANTMSCRLTRTSAQTGLSGGVRADVVFQESRWNDGEMWDATDPTKVAIKLRGKYLAWFNVEAQGTGTLQSEIWKNDATREGSIMCVLDLVEGDYLQAKVIPSSSLTEIHKESNTTPEFAVTRLGA